MTNESSDQQREKSKDAPRQDETSQQSMRNPPGTPGQQGAGEGAAQGRQPGAGIGASQGQDRGTSERDRDRSGLADGTPDVERGSDSGSSESLTQDPTGAFKERP